LTRELIVSILTLVLASLGAARIDVLCGAKVSTFCPDDELPAVLLTTNPHHTALQPWQHDVRDACWVIGITGLTLSWIVRRRLTVKRRFERSQGRPSSPNLVSLPMLIPT